MFAKPKTPAFKSASAKPAEQSSPLQAVAAVLKKPWVAPVAAAAAFVAVLTLFLNLASDPEAASPSVRVAVAKIPEVAADPAGQTSGQPMTVEDLNLFSDETAGGLIVGEEGSGVVITMPGDPHGTVAPVRFNASPLPKAPIAGLFQQTTNGPMPVIAPNGLTPAQAYARPFQPNGKPMVALIVGGLGLNPQTTKQAIEQLPPEVTLSFVPYAPNLQSWIDQARAAGHEVLIEMPMQPLNYPDNDPGPQTLMANARPEELNTRIDWVLSRATGYFGFTNYQGSAFLKDGTGTGLFMTALKRRGLAFIDDGQARGIMGAQARASAERVVDNQLNADAINLQFQGMEASAKARGSALGTGFAYPVTLAAALRWTQGLEARGLQLAPASALMR